MALGRETVLRIVGALFTVILLALYIAAYAYAVTIIKYSGTVLATVSIVVWGNIIFGFGTCGFCCFKQARKGATQVVYNAILLEGDDHDMLPSSRKRAPLCKASWSCALLVLFVIIQLVLGGMSIAFLAVRDGTFPVRTGTLNLPGLTAAVTVEREPSGVVHITAANEHDLYFAQGVVAFQERGWQMEFFRRVAFGNLSEAIGEATVNTDKYMRTLGLGRKAKAGWESLSKGGEGSETAPIFNAFCDGINAYLDTKPALSLEFKLLGVTPAPWTPIHVFGMIKVLSLDLSGNMNDESFRYHLMMSRGLTVDRINTLDPEIVGPTIIQSNDMDQFMPKGTTEAAPEKKVTPIERTYTPKFTDRKVDLNADNNMLFWRHRSDEDGGIARASNNWVVGSAKTKSRKPLLCNDPHLGYMMPSIWMFVHLKCPTVNTMGVTTPIAPGVIIGRNEQIAWGVTNVGTDVQDLYIMEESVDGKSYKYNNNMVNYDIITEVIKVKGGKDVVVTVKESVYGPVVSAVMENIPDEVPMSLHWVSLFPSDMTGVAYHKVNRASDWDSFREAMSFVGSPGQNAIYADVKGNIGYQTQGYIPRRVPGHTGAYPVPGNGSFDWIGRVPWDNNPRVYNPKENFVATANSMVVDASYPFNILWGADWETKYRTSRIRQRLQDSDAHTFETMRSTQFDEVSLLAEDYQTLVLPRLTSKDPVITAQIQRLKEWKRNATVDSIEATVFYMWVREMGKLGAVEVGSTYYGNTMFTLNAIATEDPACLIYADNCNEFATAALRTVMTRYGGEGKIPPWGEVQRAVIEHPILSQSPLAWMFDRSTAVGGGKDTVNVAWTDTHAETRGGASFRQVIDLSDMDKSVSILTGGEDGNVFGEHYSDMLELWASSRYVPMRMNGYEVASTQTMS